MLNSLASDVTKLGGRGNPLRQVIIISQSPAVVGEIDNQDLLIAVNEAHRLSLRALAKTWRVEKAGVPLAAPDLLAGYLDPLRVGLRVPTVESGHAVKEHDFQLDLPLGEVH